MKAGWEIFGQFRAPAKASSIDWRVASEWAGAIESGLGVTRESLCRARICWDGVLEDIGGDPTSRDWTSFRLLRRDREEDWSDWLAQLIEDSEAGVFAHTLFYTFENRHIQQYRAAAVHRESLFDGHRADLVIEWTDASYTHVEVKVGDPHLAKTDGTAERVQRLFAHLTRRSDLLLLLDSQVADWHRHCSSGPLLPQRVESITWFDVAYALRVALTASDKETIRWRVWAHALCGAVEQDLLGLRADPDPARWAGNISFTQLALASRLIRTLPGEPR